MTKGESSVCVTRHFGSHYSQKRCKEAERGTAIWICTGLDVNGNDVWMKQVRASMMVSSESDRAMCRAAPPAAHRDADPILIFDSPTKCISRRKPRLVIESAGEMPLCRTYE